MLEVLLLSEISVMVGDRYKKRAKSRKRDFEREKHEWSDDDSNSDVEEEHFVSQRKMRKASKEEGGEKKKQTFENPKCGPNKKKKAKKSDEKVKNEDIPKHIEHDEAEQWFTIDLPGGQGQAFLQYSIEDDGKIDLWHTEVRNRVEILCLTLDFHIML